MTKENEKNTKVTPSINISECFEIQRNLRLLFKDLYNSQTEFEADQNRLKTLQYIFETDILKTEYEKKLKDFERTSKTKKYKNASEYISKYLWGKIEEDVIKNNDKLEIKDYENNMFGIKVINDYEIKYFYMDIPKYCFYQSLNYPDDDFNIKIEQTIKGFLYSIDKRRILAEIYESIYYPEIKDTEENLKFRTNFDYLLNSNVIYKICLPETSISLSTSNLNQLTIYTCFHCSSLCEVITELDKYIDKFIKSELKFNENLSETELAIQTLLLHPNETTQQIANRLNKSKRTIENQIVSKTKVFENKEKYQYLVDNT